MILGLDALPGKLSAYAADLGNALSAELMAIAQQAADIARDAAPEGQPPRDEPRLKDSFSAEGDYLTARALVKNPHAAYVEFGTGRRGAATGRLQGGYDGNWPGMSAQPYMYPAALEMRAVYAARLARAARTMRRTT